MESETDWDGRNNLVNQTQLDEFVRTLHLSKRDLEVAGTLLRKFGVLDKKAKTEIEMNLLLKFWKEHFQKFQLQS